MPDTVHHSTELLGKSSRLAVTMAMHTADLIVAWDRSPSSVRQENRSCSLSSYLGDGCWQLTQAPCLPASPHPILPPAVLPLRPCLFPSSIFHSYSTCSFSTSVQPISSFRCTFLTSPSFHPSPHRLSIISLPGHTLHPNLIALPPVDTPHRLSSTLQSTALLQTISCFISLSFALDVPVARFQEDSFSHWCYFKPVMHPLPPLVLRGAPATTKRDMKHAFFPHKQTSSSWLGLWNQYN